MDLYLIRHPRPAIGQGICYGRSDLEPAEPVGAAAARLRAMLPASLRIYTSPLKRARLLAEALGEPVADARLQEIDFGDWELRPYDELRAELDVWAADPLGYRPPNGETAGEMALRAQAAWAGIRAREGEAAVAIVAHGGPLRAIAGQLLGLAPPCWYALDFDCGALSQLRIEADQVTLRAFNR